MYGILRPEARPRSLEDLTRFQLNAVERIVATLDSAVKKLRPAKRQDSASLELDEDRASRIFFLSGEPGTGKTTVYLSLRAVLDPEATEFKAIRTLGEESIQAEKLKKVRGVAQKLRDRVVWLEPLNLETVAGTTANYLAAVLARIDQVAADKLGTRSGNDKAPSFFDRSDLSEALVDFQRLRTDIGLAWDGNLPRRGEHLEPDAYAEEVMRAEGARIQINKRLHEVFERLTKELYDRGEDPIFVLPIDDLSLNPGPSLEILRLLRLISVRRLFVFVMGDQDGFEELVFQKVLGQLAALAGENSLRVERQERMLMARARNMAFDAQRKLLPPGQRFRLQVLYWEETLKSRLSSADPDAHSDKPLWKMFEKWELKDLEFGDKEPNDAPSNLLEFLGLPGESRIDFSETDQAAYAPEECERKIGKEEGIEDAYTAMQILEIPYRAALDLWIQTAEIGATPETTAIESPSSPAKSGRVGRRLRLDAEFSWVAGQTLLALNEQNYMSHKDRERCEDSIRGTQYTSMKLDTGVLSMEPDYGTEVIWRKRQSLACLAVRPHRRWRLGPAALPGHSTCSQQRCAGTGEEDRSGDGPGVGSWSFMPPRPAAWFVLLHDLLVLTPGKSLIGEPLTPGWNDHKWAGIRWSPPYRNPWATQNTVFVPWPMPHWPSFWQLDSFLCGWNHVVRLADEKPVCAAAESEKLTASLTYWWIRLAVSVFLLQRVHRDVFRHLERHHLLGETDPFEDDASISWQSLCADLGSVLELKTECEPAATADAERWVVHLGVMMAPEYGLPDGVVERVLEDERLTKLWNEDAAKQYIRETRAAKIRKFLTTASPPTSGGQRQGPRTLEERREIDSTISPVFLPGHIWENLIKPKGEIVFGDKNHPFNKVAHDCWNPTDSELRRIPSESCLKNE